MRVMLVAVQGAASVRRSLNPNPNPNCLCTEVFEAPPSVVADGGELRLGLLEARDHALLEVERRGLHLAGPFVDLNLGLG